MPKWLLKGSKTIDLVSFLKFIGPLPYKCELAVLFVCLALVAGIVFFFFAGLPGLGKWTVANHSAGIEKAVDSLV